MIGNDWDNVLSVIEHSNGFKNFLKIIENKYENEIVFPEKKDLFNALKLTSYENTKVVIMGQDPYHGVGEAHGLSFSVQDGVKVPPSLQNIFKELYDDLGVPVSKSGNLTKWAQEGVLLLNSVLTVKKDTPASHRSLGWELLTDYIIKALNEKDTPVVFILWGRFAKEKKKYITNPKHLVLTSTHPSPFSAYNGFFGSKPFSKTNDFLIKNNLKPIDWKL